MYRFSISIFSFVIVLSFFLPWFSVEQIQTGALKRVFTEEGVAILRLSGFNIPLQANGDNSNIILNLAKLFSPGLREFADKSWLIWLLPLVALSINWLSKKFKNSLIFNLCIALFGFTASLTAGYQVMNLNLKNLICRVELSGWFWIILLSFFMIGVLGLLRFQYLTAKKPKR
jgi:hypothetical protein